MRCGIDSLEIRRNGGTSLVEFEYGTDYTDSPRERFFVWVEVLTIDGEALTDESRGAPGFGGIVEKCRVRACQLLSREEEI